MKLNPMPEVIEGKRLVVVDDSIVRGTTTRETRRDAPPGRRARGPPARQLAARSSGRASTASIRRTATSSSARHAISKAIRDFIGADSLGYLSIDGMLTSTGVPTERFCHACFSGGYPIAIPAETARTKKVLEVAAGARNANGHCRTVNVPTPVPVSIDEPLPGHRATSDLAYTRSRRRPGRGRRTRPRDTQNSGAHATR